MASNRLDKLDLQILRILQGNCKITNLELSKRIGLSPAPTLERVKKLEQNHVISSYNAMINPLSLNLNVKTFVLVDLAWSKVDAHTKFIKKISEIPEIMEAYLITGEADFILKIMCTDIQAYEDLVYKTLSRVEEIDKMKTLVTLSVVKDSKVLPFDYRY